MLNRYDVFTAEDGLQSLEFNTRSSHKGYNGELFFGGIGGVNAINPDVLFNNPNPPQVALTGLRLFNKPLLPGPEAPLKTALTETGSVVFSHAENDLTLEYVGLHFRQPEGNQYAYRLEGYDDAWREVGTERRAVYTSLPPWLVADRMGLRTLRAASGRRRLRRGPGAAAASDPS